MFYFFLGKDFGGIRKKVASLISSILKKNSDVSLIKFDTDNLNEKDLENTFQSQGLFSKKIIVDIKDVGENKKVLDFLIKNLKEMKESENVFFWSERNISADFLKKISSHAEKVEKLEEKKEKKEQEFNSFALADALIKGDKKNLWLLYQEALMNNVSPEQMHGVLWWKVKSVLMKKKDEKMSKLADELVELLHQSRRNSIPLDLAIERWVLDL